ncbi:potassium-transporting ATPase subunit KdpA [uncultured Robinsoniella sp.]|uniref:potassium-transporting ATPase subunit KdpA n=1 Tax=Robinsoniella sp. TaxID=2496533 RepID=UPI00374EDDCC
MLQILLTLAIFLILVIPMGNYMYHIATKQKTFADPVFNRVDNCIYKICRIERQGMNWKQYALNLILANAVMIFVGYLILRLQGVLMGNPNGIGGMEASLSFNTIISFMTNTNLQHYSGESGLSYLSQMLVIIFMMFTSAASGYAACMAFCRGLAGKGKDLGNYYEDMVRITTRILIPFSFLVALLLISQGTPQTLQANQTVQTIEGKLQDIAMGPVAALESIKHLGTNGGGFFGANSTTPFENPTVISDIAELISMMILPGACVVTFGKMMHERKSKKEKKDRLPMIGRQGRVIFGAMSIIFMIGLTLCFFSEQAGNPALEQAGLNQDMGSMEGKEVRFGIAQSALFTTVTTSFTTGTVNNMHDTLTPLGGMVPLLHMMLNCVFGGKGVGLMNMIMYAILAVFLCGLMIGRTPEYLGKKIEGKEMKLVALVLIVHPLLILGFSALAVSTTAGLAGITNPGFHGLSQVLYEYSSSAANNGSGFEGLADNTVFWNVTAGLAMFFGRYLAIIAQLAIAGSLFAKKRVNETIGTLRTDNVIFTIILVFVVYIFAALTFFPALALGPIAEHLTLWF